MIMAPSLSLVSPRFRRQQTMTKADRRKGNLFFYLMGLVLLAFLCSLFYIWSRIQIVNVGYEINREISIKERLVEENKRLTLEMATLKSPVRLENLAKNEYRMDLPQKSQIVRDGNFAPMEEEARVSKKTAVSLKPAAKPTTVAAISAGLKKTPAVPAVSKTSTGVTAIQKSQAAKKEPLVSKLSQEKAAPKKATETTVSIRSGGTSRTHRPTTASEEALAPSRIQKPREAKVATLAEITPRR
jgi:cell division protein FtsL